MEGSLAAYLSHREELPLERILPPLPVMAEDIGACLVTFWSALFNEIIQKVMIPVIYLYYHSLFFSSWIEMGMQEGR